MKGIKLKIGYIIIAIISLSQFLGDVKCEESLNKNIDPLIESLFSNCFEFLDSLINNEVYKDWYSNYINTSIEDVYSFRDTQIKKDRLVFNKKINYDKVILFIISITGIQASRISTDLGGLYIEFKKNDLLKWKKWYEENKSTLKWEIKEKKVIFKNGYKPSEKPHFLVE